MSSTIEAPRRSTAPLPKHDHKVSTTTAITIAVADMIGIGVFTSLGFQVKDIPSPFALLMLWVIGGIVALCGALSYAELATALPRSGGEYNFLRRIYHPAVGFLAGWISATVGFAAPAALAAMAFGGYFAGVVPGAPPLILALAVVWGVSLVHLSGLRQGSTFQVVSTVIKLGLIVVLILAAAVSPPQPVSFLPAVTDLKYITSVPFAISLVFVLYAYSGWNAATYIADEIRDPQKSLPYSLVASTLLVAILYVALNAAFLYTTPMSEMAGQVDVALIAGRHMFGDTGGRVVGGLICIGLVSSISALMWIGPRVTETMGQDMPVLRAFSRKSKGGVPTTAILFQLAVTTIMIVTQSFEAVLDYIQFSLVFCSFLAVLGVFVLRFTEPSLHRPYRTWGYPVTPLIFLVVTAFVLVHLALERPVQSFAGVLTMLLGLAFYAISHHHTASDVAATNLKSQSKKNA
jgi:basic amino acid/polyamine antiporter, APA family